MRYQVVVTSPGFCFAPPHTHNNPCPPFSRRMQTKTAGVIPVGIGSQSFHLLLLLPRRARVWSLQRDTSRPSATCKQHTLTHTLVVDDRQTGRVVAPQHSPFLQTHTHTELLWSCAAHLQQFVAACMRVVPAPLCVTAGWLAVCSCPTTE